MTIVNDSIARQTAELERLIDAPAPPLGYGRDLSCVSDLTVDMSETDPNSPLGIAEACARRLQTPRGGLIDDPDYGFDVRGLENRGVPEATLRDLAGQIRSELKKEDRITDASVTVVRSGSSLAIQIVLTPADIALDTFAFVLSVTSGAVLIDTVT